MMRSLIIYLSEMLLAVICIKDCTAGMDKNAFLSDEKTKSTVARQFEIIGEAAKTIPPEIKLKAYDIDWRNIAGMRDRVIHVYFNVDYGIIWDNMINDIPYLRAGLKI